MQNRVSNREWGLLAHPAVRVLTGGLAPRGVVLPGKRSGDVKGKPGAPRLTHPAPSNKLKTFHFEPNYGRQHSRQAS